MRRAALAAAVALAVAVVLLLRRPDVGPAPPAAKPVPVRPSEAPAVAPGGASPPPPALVPAPELPAARVVALFARFQERFVKVARSRAHHPDARFAGELSMGLREPRLLALAAPDRVADLADALARSPEASPEDRQFALWLLNFLHEEGVAKAENALLTLARSGDAAVAPTALRFLGEHDLQGRHRDLYLQAYKNGVEPGIDFLTAWPDAGLRAWVADLERTGGEDWKHSAAFAREKLDARMAPDCTERLRQVLSQPGDRTEFWTPWALRVAQATRMPELTDVLRRRLDMGMAVARAKLGKAARFEPAEGGAPTFEERYVRGGFSASFPDPFHDDLLVVYSRLGGALTDLEARRCREFGYACDPKARLAELVPDLK